jgi:hypothetical protein
MDKTANLSLPYIMPSQAQKHVTHNESLGILDALVHLAVVDRDLATPPIGPSDGARYIVSAPATGAWTGRENQIAHFHDGSWKFLPPKDGYVAWVADEGRFLSWVGSSWTPVSEAIAELQNLALLGVGTTADATNPFAAKLNRALWMAKTAAEGGDGDLRYMMSKEAATDVLSVLLQRGFSGRAEFGLIGDDDFRLKVSPDGSSWHDALQVDRSTGKVAAAGLADKADIQVFGSSGSWAKPAGAKLVQVRCTGGGGGGGGAAKVAASTAASGGGGGGGGSSCERWIPAASLPGSVSITVGVGGSAGIGATSLGDGGNGGQGGVSFFGSALVAAYVAGQGGGGGSGGGAGRGSAGGGGGGRHTAGGNASAATAGAAGGGGGIAGGGASNGGLQPNDFGGGGGGGCNITTPGVPTIGGGAAHSGSGGAGGGGFSTANAAIAGASVFTPFSSSGIGAGAAPGGTGSNGGGGASHVGGNGGAGGAGAVPGQGGGGGGASQSGNGGDGGAGGTGEVVVITYF